MRLLLAEDEVSLSRALEAIFKKNHYEIDVVFDGETALEYLRTGNYDGAILDIMLPKLDGISVLKRLRERDGALPVLMLTARSEVADKVMGLDSGANDYLTKPFAVSELLARVRAITRAQTAQSTSVLRMGNISLSRATFELSSPTGSFRLTKKEFQMMEMLLSNPRTLIPTERFLEKIWGYDTDAENHAVWVYVSYLRKKLASLDANVQIRVSRNAGYSLEEAL